MHEAFSQLKESRTDFDLASLAWTLLSAPLTSSDPKILC